MHLARLLLTVTGRTGRIGHRGLASSFYCERDEPIASVLTRTLMETKQEVPDFLQPYVPEGAAAVNLKFETESDFDENEAAGAGQGDGWGANNGTADNGDANDGSGGNGWGPAASRPEEEPSSAW